jgi:hypothetical protein
MATLLIIHFATTWALCGLILTIQFVHYPLFEKVGVEGFPIYHQLHLKFITWIVAPLMLTEVFTAGVMVSLGERRPLFLVSLAGLAIVWISTAISQVPIHDRLALGYDVHYIRKLVRTNGWRTIGWIFRGVCLAGLLGSILSKH